MQQPQEEHFIVGNYRIEKTIGEGSYGKVKIAFNLTTNEKVAVKIIIKATISNDKHSKRVQKEIRFLKLLDHPHIVKIYDVEETAKEIFIFMEYAAGGELFEYLVSNTKLREKEARKFFRQIISAVDYCHLNCVTHRDLKLENLLLDENKNIKVIDFGFSNFFKHNSLLSTFCGSPMYAAPEMILGIRYEGPEVDIWSMGIILFALLCGFLPFDDENHQALYKKISAGIFAIPAHLSKDSRDLIQKMIVPDPRERITLEEVKNHRWVNKGYDFAPPNFLPHREEIDLEKLDEEIIQKILSLGLSRAEVVSHLADFRYLSPTVCSYHLISEMFQREEEKQKKQKKNSKVANQELISIKEEDGTIDIEEVVFQQTKEKKYGKIIGELTRTPSPTQPIVQLPPNEKSPQGRRSSIQGTTRPLIKKNSESSDSTINESGNNSGNSTPTPHSGIQIDSPKPPSLIAQRRRLSLPTIKIDFMKKNTQSPPTPTSPQVEKAETKKIRVAQGLFNVSITSSENPDKIAHEIERILKELEIEYQRDEYLFHCQDEKKMINFQIEICKLSTNNVNAVYFRRTKGNMWSYKKLTHKLVTLFSI